MPFLSNLGDILFHQGWSLGDISDYIGPETETRLVRDTGYDDTARRRELCVDALQASGVISSREYVQALEESMMLSTEYSDPKVQPAPQIEAILPNGKKVTLGESSSEPKKPTI